MGTSKMRFLFLLGALLVLFAEVAYPQGEDYQGKRGKHGFDFWKYYQGKRGKHGFLQGKRGKHGFIRGSDEDKLYGIDTGVYDESNYNKDNPDDDYQGKRGKHGFLQGKRGKHGFFDELFDSREDYQGKRGKHGFLQGKRGKH